MENHDQKTSPHWRVTHPGRFAAALCLALLMGLVYPQPARAERAAWAEWCQCAIFVVNHLGLEIIPGDYYTAGSLANPDESGRSWMDYQGFSRRPAGETPQRGDVMVIRPNGPVFVPVSGEGSKLTEVNAAWTGHIGVVESAAAETVEGGEYWRMVLISSNWGVNAGPMFVRSNCFNVDRSTVWIIKDDPESSFWVQTNPEDQRRHILNIGRQLANGYYHAGIDGTVDGYPVSGDGLTAYMWNVELTPEGDFEANLAAARVEVPRGSVQSGDALIVEDNEDGSFRGIFAGLGGGGGDWFQHGLAYWYDPASALLKGPASLSSLLSAGAAGKVKVYRSKTILPDPAVEGFKIEETGGRMARVAFSIANRGGQGLMIENASVRVRSPQGKPPAMEAVTLVQNIEIPAGHEFVYTTLVRPVENGVYLLQPQVQVEGKSRWFPELEQVRYLRAVDE